MAEPLPSWLEPLWQSLVRRRQHAHAYLLQGVPGIGKRELANRLGAWLLCSAAQPEGACGQCKSCLLLQAGSHPDVFEVYPEEPDKPIRVDQVRELVDFITRTAQLGGRKLVQLAPAEAMNLNAANALLKSLEEPSGDTVMLLVSHQPSRLLPTIRSRCQALSCPPPSMAQALDWLQVHLPEADEAQRRQLLALAGGAPLRALELQAAGVIEQRLQVEEDIKRLLKQQAAPSELAERWKAIPLTLLFEWFCQWSLQVLRVQLAGSQAALEDGMAKVIGYLAERAALAELLALQDWLLAERQKLLGKANLNPTLLLEALLVRWASLLPPR
ncbi:DNA polymerase III subunit delta' [Pseudomonas sp. NW5]|uniref:DNA polymerase III subunit delta' n=1 Tax=Pseudomonas sp. NW5 TaxID=2934934 RepID=UPI002021BA11|nr:DNA polymerase III subunit delta' [Pseudomonas sp. NW5]